MNNKEKLEEYYQDIYKNADKVTNYCLFGFFAFGFFISFYYNTYLIAILVGGLCLIAYFLSKALLKESNFYQYVLSTVYAIFTAQFIYQMHGMMEMHFCAFIGSILLISYQNWRLQLPLALSVAVHHVLFAYLQYSGNKNIYFTNADFMPLSTFIIHVLLAVIIFFLCGYWSYIFEKRSKDSLLKGLELKEQLSSVNKNIAFADEISQGNLEVTYELIQGDLLGESLLKMRDNLQSAYRKDQQDKFVNIGLARAAEILRVENNNLESLCNNILTFLIKYLEVNQGGLFVLNNNEPDAEVLELKACYAYNRKKFLEKTISPGEGLVGQAYVEGETIYLTEVPKNYVTITSGLGDSNPSCIVIVPLKINDSIFGVIEIASFSILEKYRVEFIEKIGESVATAISNTQVNEKTQRLLHESQQQSEMLRSQEEEMRQNMEELAATQEEMERKALEMEQIIEEEKKRNQQQIEGQKKEIEQVINKYEASEKLLKDKIKTLEAKYVKNGNG
jgi:methyl-accepting chemotaxis protein